jgi:integrase
MTSTDTSVPASARPKVRRPDKFQRHDHLADATRGPGPRDRWAASAILELFPTLPNWPNRGRYGQRGQMTLGAQTILNWLATQPGSGWQERWIAAGADESVDWLDDLIAEDDRRSPQTQRQSLAAGLGGLLLCRVFLPSYHFLAAYQATRLYGLVRQMRRPELFELIKQAGHRERVGERRLSMGLATIGKIVLHTDRDVDQLTAEDLLTYRAWCQRHRTAVDTGLSLAWVLLRDVTDLGPHRTLTDAVRHGQRPTAELVDVYELRCEPIRDLLVRYLDERRAALDYSSFVQLAQTLAGRFWADLEHHHPGIDALRLSEEVARGWKQRMKTVTNPDGTTRPRRDYHRMLLLVRSFYLDLHDWARDDPSWMQWAVPSPIRKSDTAGYTKARKVTKAAMHQRTRERLPHLLTLVDTAERHMTDQTRFLEAVRQVAIGEAFQHAGREYRRTAPAAYQTSYYNRDDPPDQAIDVLTDEVIDVGKGEIEAFWSWAVIEVLRHTGVRIEELLEITHLAMVAYKLPDTGEIVPMLQIVPSKSNEERLLLIGPDLASVLATIISRLRRENGGTVPLTARYDDHEHVMGPPLPHLLQHRLGWRWEVPSQTTILKWLNQAVERTGLTDAANQPLLCTPHDFRRMFATEAVAGGLPVHIVSRLLGHANVNTTQAYTAIFDEELVRSYRTFLDRRRSTRPEAEYREPTEEEWRDFQAHFQARKLALGECGRPYGSSCKHEHACIRCPSLRVAPRERPRLVEIIANLKDRIQEAKLNGWLGDVVGLDASLNEAVRKLVSLDRARERQPAGPVNLGIPVITSE